MHQLFLCVLCFFLVNQFLFCFILTNLVIVYLLMNRKHNIHSKQCQSCMAGMVVASLFECVLVFVCGEIIILKKRNYRLDEDTGVIVPECTASPC